MVACGYITKDDRTERNSAGRRVDEAQVWDRPHFKAIAAPCAHFGVFLHSIDIIKVCGFS